MVADCFVRLGTAHRFKTLRLGFVNNSAVNDILSGSEWLIPTRICFSVVFHFFLVGFLELSFLLLALHQISDGLRTHERTHAHTLTHEHTRLHFACWCSFVKLL